MKMNNVEIITLSKKNIHNFALERNILLKKTKRGWIFFVDTDEVVSKELANEISNLDLDNSDYNGYVVTRKNYFLGQYVGEDKIVRLGKVSSGKWKRMIHEIWNIKGKIGELKSPLIHNTATYLRDYITKIDFYSSLHAKANREEAKIPTLFKILFYPALKFFITLIKSKNVVFSVMQSFHSFLSWAKMYLLP